MVPNESGFNQSETACGLLLAMARDGDIIQRQHLLSLRRYNLPSKFRLRNNQTVRNGTSTADATIMRYFQTELFSRFLPLPYAGHVNLAAAKQ